MHRCFNYFFSYQIAYIQKLNTKGLSKRYFNAIERDIMIVLKLMIFLK